MSHWKVAAAQYEPLTTSLSEHVARHLIFIHAAARQKCRLVVFPALSLLGCLDEKRPLPAPPDNALLQPLINAAVTHRIIIIAGLPVEHNARFVKGMAVFAPWMNAPHICHHGHGACLGQDLKTISVLDDQPEGIDIDPEFSLFTSSQSVSEPELLNSTSRLQRFSHRFSIAVLMVNARGSSALWDENGQLIVRADRGSLLLTGQRTSEGWQGDIIPLR
ncbi:nitrilase-related carbon-nitrogen hydrolase [Citrobacter tructae]|uniref:nitrilase-related carbon-nitrogen hydrolase n=1 Tax=Citrobacter tructae TaxID=2562449 RepID=UPI003F555A1A